MEEANDREKLTLVTRKSCFGLPTSCPNCLPVYVYLKFSATPFDLDFNLNNPDSGTSFCLLIIKILSLK